MSDRYSEPLTQLRSMAVSIRTEHEKWCGWDGALYNTGTVVVLACNIAAAVIPSTPAGWGSWIPKLLLGVATFGVALDRIKNYGLRWQFHIGKKNQWGSIVDRIDIFPAWPDPEKETQLRKLVEDISQLRSSEGAIPGTAPIDIPRPKGGG